MKQSIIKDKSFAFAISIVVLYKHLTGESREYVLSKQLLRSGTSIGANVREALNAESPKDFIHKLAIAQKECDETQYWLELLHQTGFLTHMEFNAITTPAAELLKILKSIILTTKQKLAPNS